MTTTEFIKALQQAKATAILRTPSQEKAAAAMDAAIRGGFTIIEFTYSIPGALDLVREFSMCKGLVVGVGTVLTVSEAEQAVAAGANYLVSPVVDQAVIECANSMDIAIMPGCATPTEMLKAHRWGAPLQKLFPEAATGPLWVKQTLGPLPFLRIVPTSGVTLENASDYLKAGAFAVGFVNSLFRPEWIEASDFDSIERLATQILSLPSLQKFTPNTDT